MESAMGSPTKNKSLEDNDGNTDRLKFVEFESFEQLTPLTTRKSGSHTGDGKLLWAVWGNDKIPVVLKSVGSGRNIDEGDKEEDEKRSSSVIEPLENELTLLSKVIPHPNLINFFGLTKVPESDGIFVVTQYVTGGNLRQYLKQQNSILSWGDKVAFSKEIVSGLHCIHSAGLLHGNLHPNNILVQDGHMVISDFGFSAIKRSPSSSIHLDDEMIPFIEPLYLKDQSYCLDERSDIYSLGVIMSELVSGRPPFELLESNRQLMLNLIINGDRDSPIISGISVLYSQLYRRCWSADPSKRPTIEQVVRFLGNVRSETSKVLTGPPTEIRFQVEAQQRLRRYIRTSTPSSSMPAISPRVDSIGWMNSMTDSSEYDVINKEELKGYTEYSRKSTSVEDTSWSSRRREKARSLTFGTFRKPLQGQRMHESGHFQLHHSMSMSEGSDYLSMSENSSFYDSHQPKIILVARYCPAKSIIRVFEQLKKRNVDFTLRGSYKSKSVFHNLIWNDDLFDVIGINHSQQKLAKHGNFRAALKWLISNDLNINSVDDFGWTTLHEAIWKRREPGVILALLENHADPNIPDKLGATPLHQCFDLLRKTTRDDENRHIFIIMRILLQHGADPNLPLPDTKITISGSSLPNCLFAAIYMDLPLDIVELMIKRGADTTSTTFQGLQLVDFAAKMNNTMALKYLMDNKNLLSTTNKRSSIFNSLKMTSKVGSAPSIRAGPTPAKYEKTGGRKKWSILHSR